MNKERILGSLILLAGGVLLLAILFRNNPPVTTTNDNAQNMGAQEATSQKSQALEARGRDAATVDYQTEQRILEQKRAERTARAAEQERLVKAYMELQEQASDNALNKAKSEIERASKARAEQDAPIVVAQKQETKPTSQPKPEPRPKLEPTKQAQQAQKPATPKGDAKASGEQVFASANKRLKDARASAIMTSDTDEYGVQVALAASQAQADALAAKLKNNGYKVATSQTSRGVRVIVGPEKGKQAALALKDKVNADTRLSVKGAWVMNESPAELKAKAAKSSTQAAPQSKPKPESKPKQTARQDNTAQPSRDKPKDNSSYGVQVAMAGNQALADKLTEKLINAGYKSVTTSATNRGVRVVVSGKLSKDEALKLKDKLNADPKLDVNGAWIKRE